MPSDLPNAKFDHVYAILRFDQSGAPAGAPLRDLIVVKKIVRTREEAEREVARLNRLNADKGCEYAFQLTRLEKEPAVTAEGRQGAADTEASRG